MGVQVANVPRGRICTSTLKTTRSRNITGRSHTVVRRFWPVSVLHYLCKEMWFTLGANVWRDILSGSGVVGDLDQARGDLDQ